MTQQFDRLQQLDSDAYRLLCRMGCYRYQDVPTVPIEGLFCLLWDVPENRQRRVIKSLQDRSLVDCENGEFWLHPVVREEAIGRLRATEDRGMANRKAAEFWTGNIEIIEVIRDALEALEAYYHYIEINEFERAVSVVLKERSNKWRMERLDTSLYRLGILQKIEPTISEMKHRVEPSLALCAIHHILGDLTALRGQSNKAIIFFRASENLAEKLSLDLFKAMSRQNIGHCSLDLYELEDAVKILRRKR